MVWAVYGQTLHHEFVSYDDSVYVYENPVVKQGITFHGIRWAFDYNEIGHWHPVTWLSHMLDCQLYGLWAGRASSDQCPAALRWQRSCFSWCCGG